MADDEVEAGSGAAASLRKRGAGARETLPRSARNICGEGILTVANPGAPSVHNRESWRVAEAMRIGHGAGSRKSR